MTKEYYKEVNRWKLKTFFLNILKGEASRIISSEFQREELAELLTKRLIEKVDRES
mgnify:CR=1 FL=1